MNPRRLVIVGGCAGARCVTRVGVGIVAGPAGAGGTASIVISIMGGIGTVPPRDPCLIGVDGTYDCNLALGGL